MWVDLAYKNSRGDLLVERVWEPPAGAEFFSHDCDGNEIAVTLPNDPGLRVFEDDHGLFTVPVKNILVVRPRAHIS